MHHSRAVYSMISKPASLARRQLLDLPVDIGLVLRREVFLGQPVLIDAGEKLGVWRVPVVYGPGLFIGEVFPLRQVAGELLSFTLVDLFGELQLDDGSVASLHVPRRSAGADPDVAI